MTDIHKGRCQCQAIEYEFSGSPQTVHACHCSECQKRSGSACGLTMVVGKEILFSMAKSPLTSGFLIAVKVSQHISAQNAAALFMVS